MGMGLSRFVCCCWKRDIYDDDFMDPELDILEDWTELKIPLYMLLQVGMWQFMLGFILVTIGINIAAMHSGWYAWGSFVIGLLLLASAVLCFRFLYQVYKGDGNRLTCQLRAHVLISMIVFGILSLPAMITTGIGGVSKSDNSEDPCKKQSTAIGAIVLMILGMFATALSMKWGSKYGKRFGVRTAGRSEGARSIFSIETDDLSLGLERMLSVTRESNGRYGSQYRHSSRRRNRSSVSTFDCLRPLGSDITRLRSILVNSEEQEIVVDRRNLVDHVLNLYADPILIHRRIKVQYQAELGDDFGGLTKDMFTQFWRMVKDHCFTGCDVMVPSLQINWDPKIVMTSIGRIISHMLMLQGKVPYNFCRSSLLAACAPEVVISQAMLLEDFLQYVDEDQRVILKKAIEHTDDMTDDNMEELIELYGEFGMQVVPSKESVREQIATIARRELCDKPMFLLLPLGSGMRSTDELEEFWDSVNEEKIRALFTRELPTPKGVISCLQIDSNLKKEEQDTVTLLKRFLAHADLSLLVNFLIMVTGCPDLPDDQIILTFNDTSGVARRPCFHTCGNVLQLPLTYQTYDEFKREMDVILTDEEYLTMSLR